MRVVVADQPGPPDVMRVEERDDPTPNPGQVRVAVQVAAVTFVDTAIRAGRPAVRQVKFPAVLGNGVAGTVDLLGENVDHAWAGARVVTTTGGRGGYASAALAAVEDLHRIPDEVTLADAAAVLADGRTAIGLHWAACVAAGDVVVVTAAAGGVGGLLTQLGSAAGARVIGLASTQTKRSHAHDLGATTTLDYHQPRWITRLREEVPEGIDVVFDGVGPPTTRDLLGLVRPGGRYVAYGAAGGRFADPGQDAATRQVEVIGLQSIATDAGQMHALVEEALDRVAAGQLRPVIGQTYSLYDAAAAHAAIEARTTIGKTLLLP